MYLLIINNVTVLLCTSDIKLQEQYCISHQIKKYFRNTQHTLNLFEIFWCNVIMGIHFNIMYFNVFILIYFPQNEHMFGKYYFLIKPKLRYNKWYE